MVKLTTNTMAVRCLAVILIGSGAMLIYRDVVPPAVVAGLPTTVARLPQITRAEEEDGSLEFSSCFVAALHEHFAADRDAQLAETAVRRKSLQDEADMRFVDQFNRKRVAIRYPVRDILYGQYAGRRLKDGEYVLELGKSFLNDLALIGHSQRLLSKFQLSLSKKDALEIDRQSFLVIVGTIRIEILREQEQSYTARSEGARCVLSLDRDYSRPSRPSCPVVQIYLLDVTHRIEK